MGKSFDAAVRKAGINEHAIHLLSRPFFFATHPRKKDTAPFDMIVGKINSISMCGGVIRVHPIGRCLIDTNEVDFFVPDYDSEDPSKWTARLKAGMSLSVSGTFCVLS